MMGRSDLAARAGARAILAVNLLLVVQGLSLNDWYDYAVSITAFIVMVICARGAASDWHRAQH
jgi:hypothetical protein